MQRCFASMLRRPRWRAIMRAAVRTLHLPEAIRRRLPVEGTFDFDLMGSRFVYHSELYDGVGRALFWSRDYDAETFDVLAQLLREMPAGPTVVDIGANTGVYTLAALAVAPAAQVHAFEPVAHIARALSFNVRANDLSSQVHINECAVSETSGYTALHVPDESWGNATLSADGFRGLDGHLEQVRTVSLDDYVAERGIVRVDLLKIDVEGHEDAVLSGARSVMLGHRPAVLCECLPELDIAAFNDLVRAYRYEAYHIRTTGPVKAARVIADATGRCRNYLLLPVERSRSAWLHGGRSR